MTSTSHENARPPVCCRIHEAICHLEAYLETSYPVSTDRLITAKDHAAIQISIADVDANGVAQGTSTSFAISGQVRAMGESDDSINRLATQAGRESLHSFCVINARALIPPPLDFFLGEFLFGLS